MAFAKRDVKDRVVQYPRRYQLVEVQPGIFDLIPITGTVTEEGTAINKAYLQPIEDGLDAALEKTGDGKDVIVTFTEAATEAHITSGEKLSIMFGKILKMFKGKAPNSHASSAATYGVGTTANFGHCKTINTLDKSSYVNGEALGANLGKVLNDKILMDSIELLATIPMPNTQNSGILITNYLNNSGNPFDEYIFILEGSVKFTNTTTNNLRCVIGIHDSATSSNGIVKIHLLDVEYIPSKAFKLFSNIRVIKRFMMSKYKRVLQGDTEYEAIGYAATTAPYDSGDIHALTMGTNDSLGRYFVIATTYATTITSNTVVLKIYGIKYKL